MVAFKGPKVTLGLYKCNYSLTRGKELYVQPFEGNHEADMAPGENAFDTPALYLPKKHSLSKTELNRKQQYQERV